MSSFFEAPVHHQAFVVPDLDQALSKLIACGVGPVYVVRHVRGTNLFRGERHEAVVSAGFVQDGDTLLEFIEPHEDHPSAYREFLQRNPQGGLHHIAYTSRNFARSIASAKEKGGDFQIVQEMVGESGEPFEIYMEPVGVDEPVMVQLMLSGLFQNFFDAVRAAARDWDGSEPIRDGFPLLASYAGTGVVNDQGSAARSS